MTAPLILQGFEGKDEARQWQALPDGRVRIEVKFGDKDRRYTESRALKSARGIRLNEGDVIRIDWSTEVADGFVTHYPKQDQLGDFPDISLDACSIVEIHDAPGDGPPMNGDWGKLPPGGAPIYTRIGRFGHGITWPDPTKPEAQGYLLASAPLVTGKKNFHTLWFKSSSDPRIGWLMYSIDGQWLVGAPGKPTPAKTMFNNTYNYVMGGVYSRLSIGDPNLLWNVDARPGVSYPPEFVPRYGTRVYKRDDGYPRVVIFGDATYELNPAIPIAPPDPPVPTPPADGIDPLILPMNPSKVDAWRRHLIGLVYDPHAVPLLSACLTQLDAQIANAVSVRKARAADFDALIGTITALRADTLAKLDAEVTALTLLRNKLDEERSTIEAILSRGQ